MRRLIISKVKHCQCEYCGKTWLTGKRGGGLIVGSVKRHEEGCASKHNGNKLSEADLDEIAWETPIYWR